MSASAAHVPIIQRESLHEQRRIGIAWMLGLVVCPHLKAAWMVPAGVYAAQGLNPEGHDAAGAPAGGICICHQVEYLCSMQHPSEAPPTA